MLTARARAARFFGLLQWRTKYLQMHAASLSHTFQACNKKYQAERLTSCHFQDGHASVHQLVPQELVCSSLPQQFPGCQDHGTSFPWRPSRTNLVRRKQRSLAQDQQSSGTGFSLELLEVTCLCHKTSQLAPCQLQAGASVVYKLAKVTQASQMLAQGPKITWERLPLEAFQGFAPRQKLIKLSSVTTPASVEAQYVYSATFGPSSFKLRLDVIACISLKVYRRHFPHSILCRPTSMLDCCSAQTQPLFCQSRPAQVTRSPLGSRSRVISCAKVNRREALVGLSLATQTAAVGGGSGREFAR